MAGSTKEKKHTTGMDKDLRKPSGLPRPNLPPHPLTEIEDSGPDDKPPAEVSKTVLGRVEGKSWDVIGVDGVSYETAGGVGVNYGVFLPVAGVTLAVAAGATLAAAARIWRIKTAVILRGE